MFSTPHPRPRRTAALSIALAALSLSVLGAACGDDDTATPSSSTTSTPSTTPGGPVPDGSGCTPGEGDLPDGRWFGEVEEAAPGELTFDLACWFSGENAVEAAAEDGEESPPPNDYYVRNDLSTTRDLGVAAGTTVEFYPTGDPTSAETITYEQWLSQRAERGYQLGIWLDVEEGAVVAIEEQWVP